MINWECLKCKMLCAIRMFNVNYKLQLMAIWIEIERKKDWNDQIEQLWTVVIDVSARVLYMIMTLFMQNMVFQAQSMAKLFHLLLLSLYAEKCLPFFLHSTQAHIFKQKYFKNVPEYVKTNRNSKTQRKPTKKRKKWERKRRTTRKCCHIIWDVYVDILFRVGWVGWMSTQWTFHHNCFFIRSAEGM